MAIHDQTYQPWSAELQPRRSRWMALARSSFQLTWRGWSVKIIVFLILIIILFWIGILLMQASAQLPPIFTLGNRIYRVSFFENPFFHNLIMVLTAVAGAGLIARDRKYNAFSMYFSKAISRRDYIAAKFTAILAFLAMGTLLPVLILWVGQITTGPESTTAAQHFRDLLAITGHSLIIALPSGAAILALSSFSKTTYIPAIGWVLLYEGTWITSEILVNELHMEKAAILSFRNLTTELGASFYEVRKITIPFKGVLKSEDAVQSGVPLEVHAAILFAITFLSLTLIWLRIRSFEAQE